MPLAAYELFFACCRPDHSHSLLCHELRGDDVEDDAHEQHERQDDAGADLLVGCVGERSQTAKRTGLAWKSEQVPEAPQEH